MIDIFCSKKIINFVHVEEQGTHEKLFKYFRFLISPMLKRKCFLSMLRMNVQMVFASVFSQQKSH